MSASLCTAVPTAFELNLSAKRALRTGRELHGFSRMQIAKCLGHADDRLVRAWEDEDSSNHFPVMALMHPSFPEPVRAFVLAEIARVSGTAEPTGADTAEAALMALQRAAGQFITAMGTTVLCGRLTSQGAAQGVVLVENILKTGAVAAKWLRRRVSTGGHAAAGGAR